MHSSRTFVGFGFGAIQSGLFLYEAHRSGNFTRLVVAEVLPDIVTAVRRAGGCYRVNVATRNGIEVREVRGVEIFNPRVPADAQALAEALAQASEVCTALPSVEFFAKGEPSVASLIAAARQRKADDPGLPSCIVYTAENHNHAAEILEEACDRCSDVSAERRHLAKHLSAALSRGGPTMGRVQFLNTVIGKMSGVVIDPAQIKAERLACLTEGMAHAFLVEEFNRILITRVELPGFQRGIEVFIEKPDLFPFEEAKLYGHNAVHALVGYLARRKGYRFMSEAATDAQLMNLAREAFIEESGAALIARHKGLDPLFTPEGYRTYAEDLLQRMINPYLRDQTDRVTRDTPRKLGWNDRLIGTMRLALDAGIRPVRFALGAAAALETLTGSASTGSAGIPAGVSVAEAAARLEKLWLEADEPSGRKSELIDLITRARICD